MKIHRQKMRERETETESFVWAVTTYHEIHNTYSTVIKKSGQVINVYYEASLLVIA